MAKVRWQRVVTRVNTLVRALTVKSKSAASRSGAVDTLIDGYTAFAKKRNAIRSAQFRKALGTLLLFLLCILIELVNHLLEK